MDMELINGIFLHLLQAFGNPEVFTRAVVSLILLALIILLSLWQKTRLEASFIISFVRGFIQIILMGMVLIIIFSIESLWLLYLVLYWTPR